MMWMLIVLSTFLPCPGGEDCNDPEVLDDQVLVADVAPNAEWYSTRCGEVEVCNESTPTCDVSRVEIPNCGSFVMFACNEAGCSNGEVTPVLIRQWSCFRVGCIEPCFEGAPLHYSEIARCDS